MSVSPKCSSPSEVYKVLWAMPPEVVLIATIFPGSTGFDSRQSVDKVHVRAGRDETEVPGSSGFDSRQPDDEVRVRAGHDETEVASRGCCESGPNIALRVPDLRGLSQGVGFDIDVLLLMLVSSPLAGPYPGTSKGGCSEGCPDPDGDSC